MRHPPYVAVVGPSRAAPELAVGGSWGTQSEIALAVRTGLPTVTVAGWAQPAPGPEPCADVATAVAVLHRRLAGS